MKCFYLVVIVLVSLAGCRRNQPQSAEKPEPPIVLNGPLEFQMSQRSTIALLFRGEMGRSSYQRVPCGKMTA